MRARISAGLPAALIAAGLSLLAGCTGSSTPGTPAPAPAAPPAPTPPETLPPCPVVSLDVAYVDRGDAAGIARGELTLDSEDPEIGLDFASPYTIQVPDGGANLDIPGLRPTVGVFVSNLGFSTLGDGFRQTMTIEWLSKLEVRAGTPGCEPVTVTCDLQGCAGP